MHPNFKILSDESKADLKARIGNSIALEKRKARRRKVRFISFSIAAGLFICIGITAVFKLQHQRQTSTIEQFAKGTAQVNAFEKSSAVQLVLSNKESVRVSDSTTIAYDASGHSINVNNQEINQKGAAEQQYNTVLVPYGKRAKLSLSDGTLVWLNSGSKFIYPTVFNTQSREVFLEGEGVFEVAHNAAKPFYVRAANNYSVRVLGTLFNVSCYANDNKVSTSLLRGKVRVVYAKKGFFTNDTIQTDLNPGMIAALDLKKQTIKTLKQDVTALFSWRKGYYEFTEQGLESVLDKLTRYYNVNFVVKGKINEKETYSGAFKLNDDLDKVIKTLEATTGFMLSYDPQARKITIN
ncbi:FecR family protein [Flavobacterium flavigenum]|uniref:FecR family protein n=1 Tax=Flavobacterium flavigenum TaxID=3003258 RepID=UPI0022AC08A4|nr:FecR domain-containing protein [Flavobacterium flavigenum]